MAERIVCIGDSITEGIGDVQGIGWVGRLSQQLCAQFPDRWIFSNLGVAGDTSVDIKHRLFSEVAYRAPQRLIISAGLNDLITRLWPDNQGSRMNTYYSKQTWRDIFLIIKQLGIPCIVLGITPVDGVKLPLVYKPQDQDDHGIYASNQKVRDYEDMLRAESAFAGVPFIPLSERLTDLGYIQTLQDGLHPDGNGYDMIRSILIEDAHRMKFFDL